MEFFDSLSEASIQWLLKLTLASKQSTPCERVWKTVPENGVFSCVPFGLRSLGRFARCVTIHLPRVFHGAAIGGLLSLVVGNNCTEIIRRKIQ